MSNNFKLATLLAVLVFILTSDAGITPFVFWFMFGIFAYDTINTMVVNYIYDTLAGPNSYHTLEELFGDRADEINQEIDEIFKKYNMERPPRPDEDEDKED